MWAYLSLNVTSYFRHFRHILLLYKNSKSDTILIAGVGFYSANISYISDILKKQKLTLLSPDVNFHFTHFTHIL